MKRLFAIFIFLFLLIGVFFWGISPRSVDERLLLIHIRANSLSVIDADISENVKKEVKNFLFLFATKSNAQEVADFTAKNISNICGIANEIVAQNNLDYKSSASVQVQFFPSVPPHLKEGNYHFLSIILGRGDGGTKEILLHCSERDFQSRIF